MSLMEAHVLLSEVTKSGMRYILMQRVLERMCVFCGHTIRPRSSKDLRPGTISLGPGSLPCHPNPNFHLSKIMYQGRFYLSWKIIVQLHIKELLDPLKSATCSLLSFVWKEFFFKNWVDGAWTHTYLWNSRSSIAEGPTSGNCSSGFNILTMRFH